MLEEEKSSRSSRPLEFTKVAKERSMEGVKLLVKKEKEEREEREDREGERGKRRERGKE